MDLSVSRIHSCRGRNGLQVGGTHHQHYGFAHVLITEFDSCCILPRGALAGKQVEVHQRLRERNAHIKVSERTDKQRKARKSAGNFGKSLRREVYFLRGFGDSGGEIRQKWTARLREMSLRGELRIAREQNPEILAQAALDGVGK